MSLAESYKHCEDIARAEDRDRWLGSLFAPPSSRRYLHALTAFEHELGRLREIVREPMAGEIRLVWWREAVTGVRADEAHGNPIADALLDTLEAIRPPPHLIVNAIAGRQFDLYDDAFPGVAELEAYLGETRSGLLQVAALALTEGRDVGAAEASGLAGVALGLIELLRGLSRPRALTGFAPRELLAAKGATPEDFRARRMSPGVAASLSELIALAGRRCVEAQAAVAKLPRVVAPAYADLASAPLYLAALGRVGGAVFERPINVAAWRRQWALWRWSRA